MKEIKERSISIPSSLMADIAFLLLAFFLLTTTIDSETALDIVLPSFETIPIEQKNITNIFINVRGEILFDVKEVSLFDVYFLAKNEILQNNKKIFSIKTNQKTDYLFFIQVLDQLKMAHVRKISIADPNK